MPREDPSISLILDEIEPVLRATAEAAGPAHEIARIPVCDGIGVIYMNVRQSDGTIDRWRVSVERTN